MGFTRQRRAVEDGPQGRPASLEEVTKAPAPTGRVRMTVYPRAGEVVLSVLDGRRDVDHTLKRNAPANPERARLAALMRARREVRRFCKDQRLGHMWTLTYGG